MTSTVFLIYSFRVTVTLERSLCRRSFHPFDRRVSPWGACRFHDLPNTAAPGPVNIGVISTLKVLCAITAKRSQPKVDIRAPSVIILITIYVSASVVLHALVERSVLVLIAPSLRGQFHSRPSTSGSRRQDGGRHGVRSTLWGPRSPSLAPPLMVS